MDGGTQDVPVRKEESLRLFGFGSGNERLRSDFNVLIRKETRMAYSNWGAFVYKDGVRRPDKEDAGVFDTDEANLPSGMRIFANLIKTGYLVDDPNIKMTKEEHELDWARHSHHAVLGDGAVRLCGYKNWAELWVVEEGKIKRLPLQEWGEDDEDQETQFGEVSIEGNIWKWRFNQFDENKINLSLMEPDGSKWTSRCGYCYGAGHMD